MANTRRLDLSSPTDKQLSWLRKCAAALIIVALVGCKNQADDCMKSVDSWHQSARTALQARQGELDKFITTMDPHGTLPGLPPFVVKPDGTFETGPNGLLEVEIKDETTRKSRAQWDAAAKELGQRWDAIIGNNFPYGNYWRVQQEIFDKKIVDKKAVDDELIQLEHVYVVKLNSCRGGR